MKITVLGCGSSGGVPLIGNDWGTCDPTDPRNRRTRVSVLVEDGDTAILVDTSPDMRQQLLDCNLRNLTAVLFTHSHADHCHGIDDLRGVNWVTGKPVELYADKTTMDDLELRFSYVFRKADHFYKPSVHPHLIDGSFSVGSIPITPFRQNHGYSHTLGFRFRDFAYSTDVKQLDEAAFAALEGVKVWIVDCVRETPHPTHAHLEQTLEWIQRVKPERAYLTHMNHMMDYKTIAAKLPTGVWLAHDGLVIEC
jgi:phosphoribosyl 1,2-cyclic phosphate phosphodiesterase